MKLVCLMIVGFIVISDGNVVRMMLDGVPVNGLTAAGLNDAGLNVIGLPVVGGLTMIDGSRAHAPTCSE